MPQGQETAEFWKFVGGPPVNMEVKVSGQQGLCCFGHLMHSGWLVYAFHCSRIQSVNVFWWDGESSVLGMPLQEMFLRVWTIRLFPWTGMVLGMNNHFDKKPPCLFCSCPVKRLPEFLCQVISHRKGMKLYSAIWFTQLNGIILSVLQNEPTIIITCVYLFVQADFVSLTRVQTYRMRRVSKRVLTDDPVLLTGH